MNMISILGAAGGAGMALSEYLAKTGNYALRAFVAPWDDRERVRRLQELDIEISEGNITRPEDISRAVEGAWAVVNCVAVLPGDGDKRIQYEVNVRAAENILRFSKQAGVIRLVHISTAGVASHGGGAAEDESASYRQPQNIHVWSKIEAEKTLDKVSREIKYYCVIIRPASIYGPHMRFRWHELFEYARKGKMVMLDGGKAPYALIHERDLARAIELSLTKPERLSENEKIIISSDEDITFGRIVNFVANYFVVAQPRSVPSMLALCASIVLRCVPGFAKPAQLKGVTFQTIMEYIKGHRYNTTKAKNVLQFQVNVPFDDGMREALERYKTKGALL